MTRLLCPLLGLVVAARLAAADPPADGGWVWKAPDITAVRISAPAPAIDGALDDPAWKNASQSESFLLNDGRAAKSRTRLMVMRDDANLYVAVECFEDVAELKALGPRLSEHAADAIWADDCVELFIDPTNARASFYQIIVNAKEATWSALQAGGQGPDLGWKQKYAVAARIGAASWTAELSLPLAIFDRGGAPATVWAFNVSRTRKTAGELVYWSPVFNTSSHAPETFGTLSGMPAK